MIVVAVTVVGAGEAVAGVVVEVAVAAAVAGALLGLDKISLKRHGGRRTVLANPNPTPCPNGEAPFELIESFTKAITPLPGVEPRKMFGYPCAFVNGNLFAGLFQESMMMRLSPDDLAKFMKLKDAQHSERMPGRAMREYVVVAKENGYYITPAASEIEFANARARLEQIIQTEQVQ